MKVIVCGSTFGQFYCEAIKKKSCDLHLSGILANGSQRSNKCAKKYNTKLIRSIEELDEDVDIACVAIRSSVMGGKGTEITLKLLERGINVIQEQPVHYKDVELCIKTAKKNNVVYHVGNLYKHLPAIRNFTSAAKEILKQVNAQYIDASGAAQVSYALLDTLAESLPTYRPFEIKDVNRDSGPFHIVTASMGNIPVIFHIHNEVNPQDPDNHMHYLHRITIGTNSGRLCLEDTQGPVRWHNKMHFPKDLHKNNGFEGELPQELLKLCSIDIGDIKDRPYSYVFGEEWLEAISMNIEEFKRYVEGKDSITPYYTRLIAVSRMWHKLTEQLGYANVIKIPKEKDFDITDVLNKISIE